VQIKPSHIIANYMTGLRVGNVMLEPIKKQAVSEANRQIADLQSQARRVLNTDANQQTKQEAAEFLRTASAEVLKELAAKLE